VIVGAPGDGKELVVSGEGTWTVDPVTGAITFTPETGFTGNPTPITTRSRTTRAIPRIRPW
jgi:CshA-type fibril repeat protein